jgi:hypothetical protein
MSQSASTLTNRGSTSATPNAPTWIALPVRAPAHYHTHYDCGFLSKESMSSFMHRYMGGAVYVNLLTERTDMKAMLAYLKIVNHDVPSRPKLCKYKDMELFEISCCGTTFQVRRMHSPRKITPNRAHSKKLPVVHGGIVDLSGYDKYQIDEFMATHPKSEKRDLIGVNTNISDLDDLLNHLVTSRPSSRVYPMVRNLQTTAFSLEHDGISSRSLPSVA